MNKLLKTRKIQLAFLIFLAIVAYIPSFKGVWQYDDYPVIVNNESLSHAITNQQFFEGKSFFRAIPTITFAFNYSIGGYNVTGYHLVNLVVHLLSGILIYLFILELFLTIKLKNGIEYKEEKVQKIAFLATLFWMIAPINVQAVTYIVQRMTSLAGLFYFCSLLFYLKLRNNKVLSSKISYKLMSLFIISIILAFLSKQNTFLIIPTILYIEWSFYREASLKKVKLYLITTLVLIPVSMLIIYLFFSSGTDTNIWAVFQNNYTNREFSPLQRLFIEPRILIHYVSLMIFPFVGRFHLLYSFDWLNAPYQVLPYLSIIIIFSAFVFSMMSAYVKKYKILSFAVFFFLINHLMESSVIGLQLAAEHRNYIPSIGVFIMLAIGIDKLGEKLQRDKVLYAIVALFVIFLMLNTWMLNLKYQEKYCNAIYDYNSEYNGLEYDVASMAVDKLMDEQDYAGAYSIMDLEYHNIISNPHRKKFFDNYVSFSTRFLRHYVFLHYISSGFNIDNTIGFIEKTFLHDKDKFWVNVEMKKNYDNIFSYFYIKSLLFKYRIIDNTIYQKSILFEKEIIDKYFYFKDENYDEFVEYNKREMKALDGVDLAEHEKKIMDRIK
ncbi:MAG: hypothetical protein PF574_05115 [Candidatus Delongbacteria bacterium]|jgi:hypothetical protein|nr:hypothetical protein [Candidatus Delongbacteria bacterium]